MSKKPKAAPLNDETLEGLLAQLKAVNTPEEPFVMLNAQEFVNELSNEHRPVIVPGKNMCINGDTYYVVYMKQKPSGDLIRLTEEEFSVDVVKAMMNGTVVDSNGNSVDHNTIDTEYPGDTIVFS